MAVFAMVAFTGFITTDSARAQCDNLTVIESSAEVLYTNHSKGLEAQYEAFKIFNNGVGTCSGLHVTAQSFSTTDQFLAPNEPGVEPLPDVAAGDSVPVYFYIGVADLNGGNDEGFTTHYLMFWDDVPPAYGGIGDTIQVNGGLDSVAVTKQTVTSPEANADKVDSARVYNFSNPGSPIQFGDTLVFRIWGTSTTIGADDAVDTSPTVDADFKADTLDLVNAAFLVSDLNQDTVVAYVFNDLQVIVPTDLPKAKYDALFEFVVDPTPLTMPSAAAKSMAAPVVDTATVVPVFIVASGTQNKFLRPDLVEILPVELTSFEAVLNGDEIVLTWKTASETNNAGFEIQQSVNGGEWTKAAWLPGQGNANYPVSYESRLRDVEPGHYRFRLKQVDFDGSFEYSNIVEIANELPGTHFLSDAYPNPFNPNTTFTLTVSRAQEVTVAMYDILGRHVRTLYEGQLEANDPMTFQVNAADLPSGTYTYVVSGENFRDSRNVVLLK
jgi:hypothetical protein